ncbi:MAG TPA: CdaR family protein [Candidatus Methylomirabilis sp.]|nr:CdaR family protein [Candidatus Methylomirabilis sp.]
MSALTRHWELKLLALGFAIALWLFVMTSEKADLILSAPIEFKGVPAGLALTAERPESVDVQLHALRGNLSRLAPDQVKALVNLSGATPGEIALRVLPEQVSVPAGITVVRVNPSRIRVVLEAVHRSQLEPPSGER